MVCETILLCKKFIYWSRCKLVKDLLNYSNRKIFNSNRFLLYWSIFRIKSYLGCPDVKWLVQRLILKKLFLEYTLVFLLNYNCNSFNRDYLRYWDYFNFDNLQNSNNLHFQFNFFVKYHCFMWLIVILKILSKDLKDILVQE